MTPRDMPQPRYSDRRDAGRELGRALQSWHFEAPLVLGLPRGGVPVAYEVARLLDAELDVLLVGKLGAPGHEELAIGAVADADPPLLYLNPEFSALIPPGDWLAQRVAEQRRLIERRRRLYRDFQPPPTLRDRQVIVVDDGVATGASLRVALQLLRAAGVARLFAAVPVAARESLSTLRGEVDELVCMLAPSGFAAVGDWYRNFAQTPDEQVVRLLRMAQGITADG